MMHKNNKKQDKWMVPRHYCSWQISLSSLFICEVNQGYTLVLMLFLLGKNLIFQANNPIHHDCNISLFLILSNNSIIIMSKSIYCEVSIFPSKTTSFTLSTSSFHSMSKFAETVQHISIQILCSCLITQVWLMCRKYLACITGMYHRQQMGDRWEVQQMNPKSLLLLHSTLF